MTLVRSAAEMRNSFDDMRKLVAEQGDLLVDAGNKQHDRTINKIVLGGPRPQPPNFTRRSSGDDGAETPTKRGNVFRRALKGMSSRNQNDVSRIEDMLSHLLAEVETLKNAQGLPPLSREPSRSQSLESYQKLRATDPEDYTAQATSGSPSGIRSGLYPNSPGRGPSAVKPMVDRQASANRVSTVLEADEELSDREQHALNNQFENNEQMLTPTKDRPFFEPDLLDTPPQGRLAAAAANTTSANVQNSNYKSVESTPKSSNEKNRKHKSTSSSIFPKVSRWSKTTASSLGEWRNSNSARKERGLSDESAGLPVQGAGGFEAHDHAYTTHPDDRLPQDEYRHSNGSMDDLPQSRERYDDHQYQSQDAYHHGQQNPDPYHGLDFDPADDDRHFDDNSRNPHFPADDDYSDDDNRPPSPLVPSQVSEDPKYQAHRDSLNLQHPQPRPGPTHRYQRHLESQAHEYDKDPTPGGTQPNTNRNSLASPTAASPTKDRSGVTRSYGSPRRSRGYELRAGAAGSSGSRSPMSPTSDTFGSDPTLARFMPGARGGYAGAARPEGNARFSVHGGHLSPISDAGWSEKSASEEAYSQAQPPARPPKIKEEPLVPPQVQKRGAQGVGKSPLSKEGLRVESPGVRASGGEEKRWSGVSASEEVRI